MVLTYAGFNGFGKFGITKVSKAASFQEFSVKPLDEGPDLLIADAWSYAVFASDRTLLVRGFLLGAANDVRTFTTSAPIRQICVSDKHCLVLLDNGKLYKLIRCDMPYLSEIKLFTVESTVRKRNALGELLAEGSTKITHIACGAELAVAITNTNEVYSIPSKIHQFPVHIRVKQLVCGFEHALVLTGNGDIYSWGNGLKGQLGHCALRVEETPTLIEALAGIKINFIAAGGWHSAAISAFGDLYTWGYNSSGQLGIRGTHLLLDDSPVTDPKVFHLPQLIDLPTCDCRKRQTDSSIDTEEPDETVCCEALKIYAGARHSVLQTSCGRILGTGWNEHGQLSLGANKDSSATFQRMSTLQNYNIDHSEIVCGPWSTIINVWS